MSDIDNKNYYDVLEVSAQSTLQDIHNAYMSAKNAYAGDSAALYSLMSQDECDKILSQIEEAYSQSEKIVELTKAHFEDKIGEYSVDLENQFQQYKKTKRKREIHRLDPQGT